MPGYSLKQSLGKPYNSEAELWQAFKSGCELAYAHLYQQYAYLLYSYGNKISPDTALVEDCIQDLFIKLWVNKSHLGEPPSPKHYILKAYRRLLLDALQKNKFSQEATGQELDFKLTLSCEQEESQQQFQLEKEKKLQGALEKLSSRQKEVIYLRFYKKMANEEIAEIMAISVPSVYNLVCRALAVLEGHLYLCACLLLCRWLLPE